MNPLLALRALTSDIKHTVGKVTDDESSLGNPSGLDTRAKDILVVWQVVRLSDTIDGIEITKRDFVSGFSFTVLFVDVQVEDWIPLLSVANCYPEGLLQDIVLHGAQVVRAGFV